MTEKKRRIKHLYRTSDEVFNLVKIHKIKYNKRSYDYSLDDLIRLGVKKKEELEKQEEERTKNDKVEVLVFY